MENSRTALGCRAAVAWAPPRARETPRPAGEAQNSSGHILDCSARARARARAFVCVLERACVCRIVHRTTPITPFITGNSTTPGAAQPRSHSRLQRHRPGRRRSQSQPQSPAPPRRLRRRPLAPVPAGPRRAARSAERRLPADGEADRDHGMVRRLVTAGHGWSR